MDRSDDILSVAKSELRSVLRARYDGYWELVATAAGHSESVDRTAAAISADAIEQGARGPAIAPSMISERVEALAAGDLGLLVRLAEKWRRPNCIGDDPWWAAAWSTALRHLKAVSAIDRRDAEVAALSSEVKVLWDNPVRISASWQSFQHALVSPFSRYQLCRQSAQVLLTDKSLGSADLETAYWEMLRILRGHLRLLDSTSIDWIRFRLSNWTSLDPLEASLICEIGAEVAPDGVAHFCYEVARFAQSANDIRRVIPFVYVLASDWRAP